MEKLKEESFKDSLPPVRNAVAAIRYFQENLASGKPNNWSCRAGARYLYVCEDGLVHYCSQQRGYPGIPLEKYSVRDIRREFETRKPCAPYCTITCVHQASTADFWRPAQALEPTRRPSPQPFVILEE